MASPAPALAPPARLPADFQEFYREHAGFVRSVLARILGPRVEPDDLMQEVFLLAHRKYAQIHPQAARVWLCQSALRLAANARRMAWIRQVFGLGSAAGREEPAVDQRTPERIASARETTRQVYAALETLSEKRRAVFILYEIQGLSGQEIGEVLGLSLQTVHTHLFRARRDFAEAFAQYGEGPRTRRGRRGCR